MDDLAADVIDEAIRRAGPEEAKAEATPAAEAEMAKLQTKEPKGDDGDGEEEWEKAVDAVAAFLFAPKKKSDFRADTMPSRMRNDEEEEDPPSSRRIGVGLSVEEALDEIAVELFLFPNNRRLSSPRQPRPPPRQRLDRWCCCPCGCFLAGEMFFAPPTLLRATTTPTTP